METKESIEKLSNFFDNNEGHVDYYFNLIEEILNSLFQLKVDEFWVSYFHDSLSLIGGKDFSEAVYTILYNYDMSMFKEEIDNIKNDALKQYILKIAAIYGPKVDNIHLKNNYPNSLKYSKMMITNENDIWSIQIDITTINGNTFSVKETPDNILDLCIDMLKMLNKIKSYAKLKKRLISNLKKEAALLEKMQKSI
jgi:hypothetical protein